MAPSRAAIQVFRTPLRHLTPPSRPAAQTRSISAYGYEQAKCLVIDRLGEPQDVLRLHGHSISPPTGDAVTIKFLASPINPADINQIQGVYPTKPTWTTTLGTPEQIAVGGNEGVAEVIGTGARVQGLKRGDWVIFKQQGFGTWRTHAQTTADQLLPIRDRHGLTPAQVGTVSVNPCTAYQLLKQFGDLRPGDWFVQNGANSGVGRAAIQLARLWGFRSINVVRQRARGDEHDALVRELHDLGADLVVTDAELRTRDFRDRVRELTDGGRDRVGSALNCVGGPLVTDMARLLSPGAPVVTYGAMSKQPVQLPMGLLIFKDVSFSGFWVSRWSDQHPRDKEAVVHEILELTRQGKFKDVPMQPIEWTRDAKQDDLVDAVRGTLEGYRSGKGIFMFHDT